ncbi:hypothetical protein CKM354_000766000 [Cercospora kikuchii]|uniref:Peptidase C45 hydrolase domain-containing protein n=1 Tax=Cercospora kikuchii TaxID=84275 RepID=A0A9P3FEJ2_9PEZI|nr:uncharacterized protein CKM354_000766000 [Cercospora kikuchii]GIZ44463.1 hypothetical protein CKM354_000766000 [Cercospora kikuchii]
MLQIHCSGSPREIGLTHGTLAKPLIHRTIAFYTSQFQASSKLSWPEVRVLAKEFIPNIRAQWPQYLEEMEGIAEGAGVEVEDVVACNVRTEITFGLWSDGCTALGWKVNRGEGKSWLAQNWDWDPRQGENLILVTIDVPGTKGTKIKMVTEAGIIGKIGLNSNGVGVCLNAIKARGVDKGRLPVHLGLRKVLESETREQAVGELEKVGIASACHVLISDAGGSVGLEWSAKGVKKVEMNGRGQVFHSNHFLEKHPDGVEDTDWLVDSRFRVKRIEELVKGVEERVGENEAGWEDVRGIFRDEENWPGAICRSAKGKSTSQTLFNIVMELRGKKAKVVIGRPTEGGEEIELSFEENSGRERARL